MNDHLESLELNEATTETIFKRCKTFVTPDLKVCPVALQEEYD